MTPLPSWGPALLHHRIEAAKVHDNHGTTFAGKIHYVGDGEPIELQDAYHLTGEDHDDVTGSQETDRNGHGPV